MIKINYRGRLGNNLFQYAFSRLVADCFGYKLCSDLPPNPILRATPIKNGKIFITSPVIIKDGEGNYFPESLEERTYITDGYYQNIDYYKDKRDEVKSFFRYHIPEKINFDDIVIHVRLKDYKIFGDGGTVIHPCYYIEALKKESFRKVYVVTDEPSDKEYFSFLAGYEHEFFSGSSLISFYFLMGFNRMVMGNSSFSWWAAFLGNPSKVYTFKPWIKYCSHINKLWDVENAVALNGTFKKY